MMNKRKPVLSCLALTLSILLSACDGGIFGTGGIDEFDKNAMDMNFPTASAPIDNDDSLNSESPVDPNANQGDPNGNGNEGVGGDGVGQSVDNNSDNEEVPSGTDLIDSNPNDAENATRVNNDFINTIATLSTIEPRLNLINTTGLSLNVIDNTTGTTEKLFVNDGIAPKTTSNSVKLNNNTSQLDVIENGNVDAVIYSFSNFQTSNSTLSTLLVRSYDATIDAIPLVTTTETSDPMLASVRVVYAGMPTDSKAVSMFTLFSAGDNPGGIDQSFGPLGFDSPLTEYIGIPSGDYELRDPLNRIPNQVLSFSGGTVYTLVLTDDVDTSLMVVIDSTE